MTASVQTPTVGVGRLIQDNTFFVPKHQRDYSWTLEYVNQYLEDIEKALFDRNEEYFFGLMVFTRQETSSRLSVIDGQQRLATTVMLLSAIRGWMFQYPKQQRTAHQISDRYIAYSRLGSDVADDKIILNTANHDTFHRLVIEQVSYEDVVKAEQAASRYDRNKLLLEAARRISEFVREKAGSFASPDEAAAYFVSLISFLDNSVRVVSLVPGGEEDAYTIFETLNDRGLTLAPLDLVKNFLFGRAERHQPGRGLADMEARWTEMMTVLERARISSFLRVYWASRYGLTEKLFASFKRRFDAPRDAYSASIELRDVAESYVALNDPADSIWTRYRDAPKRIDALTIIGATQLYPLILSALERFNEREISRLLHLIEVIGVRYQLVARGRPGRMESLGSQVARRIFEKTITSASEVRKELTEIYPSDDVFRSDFLTKTEKDKRKANYILRALELQNKIKNNVEHPEEDKPGDVTIEHIMPKSLNSAWRTYLGADADRHSEYRDRVGNLCLLGKANARLGAALFDVKRTEYVKSRITITTSLSRYGEWRCDQIDARQKAMADLAVQAWRFQ